MINEYLFEKEVDNKIFDELIERFSAKNVVLERKVMRNTSSILVSLSISKNDLDSAKVLSDINCYLEKYTPVVVTCESSEYFNKVLYPLINKLERKLRKLLYLAAKISENNESSKQIYQLEKMDFGKIFEMLFTSDEFIKEFRKKIKESKFSKRDIDYYLFDIEEKTLWNNMFTNDDVPTLRRKYPEVRTCRNAVMHAHNIDKKMYADSKKLFSSINYELDVAINNILEIKVDTSDSNYSNVSKELGKALNNMEHSNSGTLQKNIFEWLTSNSIYEKLNVYNELNLKYEKLFETNGLEKMNEIINKIISIYNENDGGIED